MKAHHVVPWASNQIHHPAHTYAIGKETLSSHLLCLSESVFAITLLSLICGGFLLLMYSAIALL